MAVLPEAEPRTVDAAELIAPRFRALGDPTRLRILDLLRRGGEIPVTEIAAEVESSQQNVSKHLAVLLAVGFVTRRKVGTSSLYRIGDPAPHEICARITEGLTAQLSDQIRATVGSAGTSTAGVVVAD